MSERERDDDTRLVQAARDGDKAAFAALLTRHRPLLLALCRRTLGDPDLAEDAAQEASLQALLGLDRLQRPERFGSWLAGIGLNVCRRSLRQNGYVTWSWEALQGGRLGSEPPDTGPGPAELAAEADLAARIRRAVTALPPGQRQAVLLVYLSGLTQAETAAVLGIDVGAVKTRLHKARRALRQRLWAEWKEVEMDEKLTRRTFAKATGAAAGLAAAGQLAPAAAASAPPPTWVDVRVADVRRGAPTQDNPGHHVVILAEIGGERRLPIWMGEFEATAIALHLEQVPLPRPMTYAFAAALLKAADGALREVRINKLEDVVFYAEAVVGGPHGAQAVDARPSDALNLALLAGAPIRVATDIFQSQAAVADTEENRTTRERKLYGPGSAGAAEIAAALTASWGKPCPVSPSTGETA